MPLPTSQAVLDVDFTRLLPSGQKLLDGATSLRVVIDVREEYGIPTWACLYVILPGPVGLPRRTQQKFEEEKDARCIINPDTKRAILKPQVFHIEADGTFVDHIHENRYDPFGTDGWMPESFKRVCTIATENKLPARIPRLGDSNHQLVSIEAYSSSPTWIGAGVFKYPEAAKTYFETRKSKGVHGLGRAALMHKVLFSVAGMGNGTPGPLLSVEDSWSGTLYITRADLMDVLTAAVKTAGADAGSWLLTAKPKIESKLPDEKIMIVMHSQDLNKDTTDSVHAKLEPFLAVVKDSLASNETLRDALYPDIEECVKTLVPDLYKKLLITKMKDSATFITPQLTETAIDTSNGIYGVYSRCDYSPKADADSQFNAFFQSPPYAVSASFGPTKQRVLDHVLGARGPAMP